MIFSQKFRIATFLVLLTIGVATVAHAADVKLIVPIGTGANKIVSASVGPDVYVKTFYQWSIGLAALFAMLQLVVGGIQYVLAAGSISSKEAANERMRGAVTGLIILVAIVTILTTINPSLVTLTPASVAPPAPGSINFAAIDASTAANLTTLQNASSSKAADDSRKKIIEANKAGDKRFTDALKEMEDEIYQFAQRSGVGGNDNLEEVIGDANTALTDANMPLPKLKEFVSQRRVKIDSNCCWTIAADDFWEYANKAYEAYNNGDKVAGDGYSDAVRSAVNTLINSAKTVDKERIVLLISVVEPTYIRDIILGKYKR